MPCPAKGHAASDAKRRAGALIGATVRVGPARRLVVQGTTHDGARGPEAEGRTGTFEGLAVVLAPSPFTIGPLGADGEGEVCEAAITAASVTTAVSPSGIAVTRRGRGTVVTRPEAAVFVSRTGTARVGDGARFRKAVLATHAGAGGGTGRLAAPIRAPRGFSGRMGAAVYGAGAVIVSAVAVAVVGRFVGTGIASTTLVVTAA